MRGFDLQMSDLVDVSALKIEYPGNVTALDKVSFGLGAGEILGIVGESGSGKTTLIRALINLPAPGAAITGGRFLFNGKDTATFSASQWRKLRGGRIGMIFQNPGATLTPMMSVARQFVETLRNHCDFSRQGAREMALREIERMQLKDPAGIMAARPWQLSGGMKQRVALAMSLAVNPDLILADEPTSALDVTTQAAVMAEFDRRRRETGTAIIMVSHNISACAAIADRLMVMKDGRAVDCDTTGAILARPGSTYVGRLRRAIPRLKEACRDAS